VVVDFDDPTTLARAMDGADAVIHAAGNGKPPPGADPDAALRRQNVDPTRALLQVCGERRFVFVSSIAAHGPSLDGMRPRPGAPDLPLSAYGRSKLEAERLVEAHPRALTLRPPPVYGPGDANFLPLFRAARWGFVPVISPTSRTSLIHVRDLADALVAACGSEHRGTWSVDDGVPHTWGEVVAELGRAVGREARPLILPRRVLPWAARAAEEVARRRGAPTFFTSDKARDLVQPHWLCGEPPPSWGWVPRISLREGLAETAASYARAGW
jgi:nucleoside-diphosphate-sugar epimerase